MHLTILEITEDVYEVLDAPPGLPDLLLMEALPMEEVLFPETVPDSIIVSTGSAAIPETFVARVWDGTVWPDRGTAGTVHWIDPYGTSEPPVDALLGDLYSPAKK